MAFKGSWGGILALRGGILALKGNKEFTEQFLHIQGRIFVSLKKTHGSDGTNVSIVIWRS